MADDGTDGTLRAVGARLRALRQERDTTLAELSAATGVSVSTLSRLESGARRPTLELLLPLAKAHGVTLDELVDAPPTGDPRINLRPITRGSMTMIPLTRRPGGVQAYKLILPAGSRAAAQAHVCRTVARRAERMVVALEQGEAMRPAPRQYLNRLSDLLFVLARVLNRVDDGDDVYWKSARLARMQAEDGPGGNNIGAGR